ncbi:MAG: GNAT family N-acetyltransferase [Ruminococcaceae bacterium]|nr:GNAT family N-acetyltransferase [Oscillospiraceae bacterium]
MYRLATGEDRPALVALWQEVFGDDPAFINRCLDDFAGPGNVYLSQAEDGLVNAVLSAVPCRIGFHQGVYMYALATSPSARSGGIMTGLMTYAERRAMADDAAFSTLIPASLSLFGYYLNRGYTQDIVLRHLEKPLAPKTRGLVNFSRLSAADFTRLREKYTTAATVMFSADRLELVLDDLYAGGFRSIQTLGGYAIFTQREDTLLVAELFAKDDDAADTLLAALADQTGATAAHLTLAETDGPYLEQGHMRPAALIKELEQDFSTRHVYLRFALDAPADVFW